MVQNGSLFALNQFMRKPLCKYSRLFYSLRRKGVSSGPNLAKRFPIGYLCWHLSKKYWSSLLLTIKAPWNGHIIGLRFLPGNKLMMMVSTYSCRLWGTYTWSCLESFGNRRIVSHILYLRPMARNWQSYRSGEPFGSGIDALKTRRILNLVAEVRNL
ncbi:hypothetical protein BDV23DRAFT_10826 [Aspergillus alliaceus]|uniref:Uncharacterized protein n=1 Tax=Petromyces alliaceus TaxID=209559 RepID=A0A5N7CJH6_PETAA|nr:hypothetical protein BDV23DRAFT_10826 [Aspergillus alliaceus]